jgi:protein involved in polysaccharide export with SLBB domain
VRGPGFSVHYEGESAAVESTLLGLLSPTELAAAERALAQARATFEQLRIADAQRDERATPVDPARPIAVGDTLQVFISDEPDLPTTYVVRNDGTIRLPLLGGLKVAGQPAEQVRGAITRLLADRRLGAGSEVSVTIRQIARVPGR